MLPAGTYSVDYGTDTAVVRTNLQWGLLIGFLILLFCLPLFLSNYLLAITSMIAITIVSVMGLNILTGYCGQISLGQAAFMMVGAYTAANLAIKLGMPFWVTIPAAGIVSALIGVIIGLPAARVKGFYLAMVTLGFQFIATYIVIHAEPLTGGVHGMMVSPPEVGGLVLDSEASIYYLIMAVTIVMVYLAKNIVRTRAGRALIAIRDNDLAAEIMGINLLRHKLLAFAVSSFYAGVAGALWCYYVLFINVEQFTLMDSIWQLGMIIIGGMGSIMGAIYGVLFIKLLQEGVIASTPLLMGVFPAFKGQMLAASMLIVFGVIVVLFLVFEPRGIAHRWEILKSWYRLWPFSY